MIKGAALTAAIMAGLAAGPAQLDDDISARLKSQSQALVDALATGDRRPWSLYLDERVVYTDEDGGRYGKAEMLAQVTPLPHGVSGHIELAEWHVSVMGAVAVETHVDDEHEDFHGQRLHALYRVTDTWLKEPGGWKLIASQTLALQQDPPAAAIPDPVVRSYVGRYAAAPDYVVEISRDATGLVARTNGGKPQALKAELEDVLFTPGEPRTRKIFQRDAAGRVTGFVSRREERDVVFRRLDGSSPMALAFPPAKRAESCPPKLL
jgi:hypothetical protein